MSREDETDPPPTAAPESPVRLTRTEQEQLNEVLSRRRVAQEIDYDKVYEEPTMKYALEMEQQGYVF